MTWGLLTWPIRLRHHSTWLMPPLVVTIYQFSLSRAPPLAPFFTFTLPFFPRCAPSLSWSENTLLHTSTPPLLLILFHYMFLIVAEPKTRAKHETVTCWMKTDTFSGIRWLVVGGEQYEAAWPDYKSIAHLSGSLCGKTYSLLSFIFAFSGVLEIAFHSSVLPCWQLSAHINRIHKERGEWESKRQRNRMITFVGE